MTQSFPETMNVWFLALQGTTARPNEFLLYALADNTEDGAKSAEAALKAAKPGEFVDVEVRFPNLVDSTTLHVQPHLWGLWCVSERVVSTLEMFASRKQQ